MSGKANKVVELMDQQMALHSYLEEMLREVPDYVEPDYVEKEPARPRPVALAEAPAPAVVEAKPVLTPVAEPVIPPDIPLVIPQVKSEVKPVQPEPETVVATALETKSEQPAKEASALPEWVTSRFQCLLFNVAGITLAVPLEKLNGVIPWNEENITPMPGHSPAFLGLLRHLDKNVKVMDTAQVILPEKQKNALQVADPQERIHKIILMDEGRWGLACDEVGEVITLEKSDVRWRTAQGKRPWLAGTVSERLCALLDTDVFGRLLEEGFATGDHL